MTFVILALVLAIVILFLAAFAVMQIKMAGMEVNDFWSFIKANDTLNKLYAFSIKYQNLTPQQQILFLKETENVFSAFEKVPDALWEEDYDKYMEILSKYKDIKMKRWEESSQTDSKNDGVIRTVIYNKKDDDITQNNNQDNN